MAAVKYLDLTGLQSVVTSLKGLISDGDAKAFKSAKFDEVTRILSLYKAEATDGTADFTVEIPETDISGLLEKLTTTNVGNVVITKADGTVEDGGIALTDLATKEEVKTVSDAVDAINNADTGVAKVAQDYTDEKVGELADGAVKTNTEAIEAINDADTGILKQAKDYADEKDTTIAEAKKAGDDAQSDVDALETLVGVIPEGYTATTIAEYAKELADNVASNGYDDTELSGKVDTNTEDIAELDTNKADKATTLEGYGIADAYTKGEVDTAITTAIANANHLKREIVDTLPDVADGDVNTIYMVSITDGAGNQKYEEFMLINDAFEKIGDSAVDLTDYATDSDVSTAKTEAVDEAKSYADGLAVNYDTAGSATAAQTNAQTYADGLNTAMDTRVDALETLIGDGTEAISPAEIEALFV